MSIFDRLSDRVGDFLEEVMLPEEIHALHQRAREAIEAGDYRRALQFLGEAEHRRPNTERTRRLRGLCHFHLGNLDRAIELLGQALEIREEGASHFYLGLCFEQKGQFDEAQAHFQRALNIDEDPPFAYDLYFGLGRTYMAQNRPDKATRELRRALRIWPDQLDASALLAEALRQRGQSEDAAQVIRPLTEDTNDRDALFTLGRVEASLGNFRAAANAFDAILELDPTDREVLLEGARAHLSLSRPARANELLIRALSGGEEDADIFALIGETNERVQNRDKARQSYEAALKRNADHQAARIGAGRMALKADDYEQAAEHFGHLLQAPSSPYRAEALLGLGRCRLALGDSAGARHLLEEADQLHRRRPPELLHALGQVALESDDAAEALVALRRALQANPDEEIRREIEADMERALAALRPAWEMPDSFDSTAELVTVLSDLREIFRLETRLEPFASRVHDLLHALERPLSVAILGEFNAGKSTLVNAILGEKVVPMGVLPTTAHPCIMTYGPRKGVRIAYEDGRLEDVDFENARRLMKEQAAQITRLDYTYPHPELRSMEYWDTPGFNALDERHEALADQALDEAEAIVWLLDSNQALKETEFARLQAIPDSSLRVILVVNKIDRLGDPESRTEQVDEILEYLDKSAGDQVVDLLAISALEALNARLEQAGTQAADDAELPGDFKRLLELLDRQFVQRSWRIKIADVSRGLQVLLDDVEELRQEQLQRYGQLSDQACSLKEIVHDQGDAAEDRAREHAITLADRFEFVTVGVEREIDEALRRRGRILRRLVLEPDDRRFILELLRERLDHVLNRTRRDILDEISQLEANLAERISPLLATLSVTEARPMRRRLEGFFDETRAMKRLLDERVFGQWRARTEGRLTTGGERTLDAIVNLGDDARSESRRELLSELIPSVGDDFAHTLCEWYREFFLAARRFCDRLCGDLSTLELEARHRLDFSTTDATDKSE